jgi:transcriptional antiterminator NusG
MLVGDRIKPWFAVQVKGRREKMAHELLQCKGYESFLPLYQCKRRWSDRIKEFELPLFPGYLFCRFNPYHRLGVLKTLGVVCIVGLGKVPVPITDEEIAAVRSITRSHLPAQPWPFLQIGKRVRIESGPLRGLEGIILSFKSNCRLVVSVNLLQRSVAVEIDSTWVEEPRWTDLPFVPASP